MKSFTEDQQSKLAQNGWLKHNESSPYWEKESDAGCRYTITIKAISDKTWFIYDYDCPSLNVSPEDSMTKTFTTAEALFRLIKL